MLSIELLRTDADGSEMGVLNSLGHYTLNNGPYGQGP